LGAAHRGLASRTRLSSVNRPGDMRSRIGRRPAGNPLGRGPTRPPLRPGRSSAATRSLPGDGSGRTRTPKRQCHGPTHRDPGFSGRRVFRPGSGPGSAGVGYGRTAPSAAWTTRLFRRRVVGPPARKASAARTRGIRGDLFPQTAQVAGTSGYDWTFPSERWESRSQTDARLTPEERPSPGPPTTSNPPPSLAPQLRTGEQRRPAARPPTDRRPARRWSRQSRPRRQRRLRWPKPQVRAMLWMPSPNQVRSLLRHRESARAVTPHGRLRGVFEQPA
jgi:hypothetical protein